MRSLLFSFLLTTSLFSAAANAARPVCKDKIYHSGAALILDNSQIPLTGLTIVYQGKRQHFGLQMWRSNSRGIYNFVDQTGSPLTSNISWNPTDNHIYLQDFPSVPFHNFDCGSIWITDPALN